MEKIIEQCRRKGEGKWREEERATAVPNREGKAKSRWTVSTVHKEAPGERTVARERSNTDDKVVLSDLSPARDGLPLPHERIHFAPHTVGPPRR